MNMRYCKILILFFIILKINFIQAQTTPEEIFAKGIENFMEGNHQDAVKYLDEYVLSSPNDFRGYNYRGLSYQLIGDYQRAIEDFTKVVSLGKTNIEGYINRGNTYLLQGAYSSAVRDFTDAIENNPNDIEGYIGRSRVYTAQKDFTNAINDLNRASGIDAKNSRIYLNKVWVYLLARDTLKLFENIKTVLHHDSNMAVTNFKTDLLYLKVENYSNMLSIVNEGIEKYPGSYLVYFMRGMVFYMLNRYENAEADFITSLKLNTNNDPEYLSVVNHLMGIIKNNNQKF